MKIRDGFVSNSSSSSFVLQRHYMSQDQINKLLEYNESLGNDKWEVYEDGKILSFDTLMTNVDLEDYAIRELGINPRAFDPE